LPTLVCCKSRLALANRSCAKLILMKGRVLIIDSDRELSAALRDQLKALGYEVRAEPNNHSGIEVAESFSPSVIITDSLASLPDSLSRLREIRANSAAAPFILPARH